VIHKLEVFLIIYYYIIYNNEIVFFNSNDASISAGDRRLFTVHKQHRRKNETHHDRFLSCCRYLFIREIADVQRQ